MKQAVLRFYGGYLRIRLVGFSPERFLNLCMANQISIWDLRYVKDSYQFYIMLKDYRRVKPLVRKSHVRLKIEGRYGLPFFLHRNRRRKLYAAGVAAFFAILFIMSNYIWNITLEGNYRFTDDMLLHYLDSQKIRYGVPKKNVDCDSLEESIRTDFPEIIWVSARISGTRLMIRIKENDVIGTIPKKDEEPRDLVASKGGVITSMIVRRGKPQVKIGDTIEPGQLLVSGTIPIYNDAEELVNCRYVRADADIIARTEFTYSDTIPHFVAERSYTGRTRKGLRLKIADISFLWILPSNGEETWEISAESHQAVLFQDFYLPVWFDKISAREYALYERKRTNTEAEAMKEHIQNQKMKNLMEKGVQIIENDVKISDKNTCWLVQGHMSLEEPVGVGQNITQTEEIKQADERNGDNH